MFHYPRTTIPTLPGSDNFCLWQIHKDFSKGSLSPTLGNLYACGKDKPFETQHGSLSISIELISAGPPCDQDPQLIPNGSVLTAKGVVIRRKDGLADFTSNGPGSFIITAPNKVQLFSGFIELMVRVGTHHFPFGDEACNPENHIEGWLVGLGKGELSSICLRALLAANGTVAQKDTTPITKGTLNGVLLKPSSE